MLWKCCTQYASTFVNSAVITGLEKVSFCSYPKEGQSERMFKLPHSSVQSLSHIQLCNPMDCSTPGFPVHHQIWSLLKLMSVKSVIPYNHLILRNPLLLPPSVFPSIRVFSNELAPRSGGHSIGGSVPASALPMNIQGWFPLGLTSLIPLLSKGVSYSSPAP